MLQPLQAGQALLASRTVSWNPANFSQALLQEGEAHGHPDVGRNSQADYAQADYAPGVCAALFCVIAWHSMACTAAGQLALT